MLQDLVDPNPDDHLWKCIAITKHKVRNLDEEDIHVKVKALWADGEETWIWLNALQLQEPFPLITYAVKQKLTKHPDWQWTKDYLKDDERMESMVRAYKHQRR